MNEYGVAVDGMIYHDSQVTKDEHGRRFPKQGAQAGYILRGDEFGQMPELTAEAGAFLEAWQQGGAEGEAALLTPATPTHVATYGTKVVVPEPSAADILTKADEGDVDAPAETEQPAADEKSDEGAAADDTHAAGATTNAPRSRPGGR